MFRAWGNPWFPHELPPRGKKGARGVNMVSPAPQPMVPPRAPSFGLVYRSSMSGLPAPEAGLRPREEAHGRRFEPRNVLAREGALECGAAVPKDGRTVRDEHARDRQVEQRPQRGRELLERRALRQPASRAH